MQFSVELLIEIHQRPRYFYLYILNSEINTCYCIHKNNLEVTFIA